MGGHAINLDLGSSSQILFGHLDFTLHNYDALAWYGVPKSMFCNEDGTKKASVSAAVPQNQSPLRGQDFHVYAACTGKCARLFHAMVGSVL